MTSHGARRLARRIGNRRQVTRRHAGRRATLPAPFYTDGEFFNREMESMFRDVVLRRPCRGGRTARSVRASRGRRRQHHRDVDARRPRSRVPQRLPSPRHTLCTEATGAFGGSIQCPYHAWTYELDGWLLGAPHMDEVPHFRKSDYPLHRVQADVWDGHIFLNLSREPRHLHSQLGDLRRKFYRGRCRICVSATASSTTSGPTGS